MRCCEKKRSELPVSAVRITEDVVHAREGDGSVMGDGAADQLAAKQPRYEGAQEPCEESAGPLSSAVGIRLLAPLQSLCDVPPDYANDAANDCGDHHLRPVDQSATFRSGRIAPSHARQTSRHKLFQKMRCASG
jgi:hypothetical protein